MISLKSSQILRLNVRISSCNLSILTRAVNIRCVRFSIVIRTIVGWNAQQWMIKNVVFSIANTARPAFMRMVNSTIKLCCGSTRTLWTSMGLENTIVGWQWLRSQLKSARDCVRISVCYSTLKIKKFLISSSQRQNHQLQHSRIRHRNDRLRESHELPRLSNARANRAMFSSTRLRQNTRSLWQKAKRNRLDNPRILGFSVDRSNGEINFISFYFKIAFLSQ